MKKFMLIIALVSAFVSVSFAASRDYSLPTQEGVTTLDELYTKCAEVQDEFSALMESLSQELGAKLVMRPGLKSRERTIAKAAEIFDGDYSKIFDVLAASLIFDSEEEIYRAVDRLKAKSNFVYFYDRWREHQYDNGYRDYYTLVRLSNGIIAEVQLHHSAIFEFSGNGDHYIYEFVRAQRNNPGMLKYVKQVRDIQREFFNAAAEGRYSSLPEEVKSSVRELAEKLSSQTTPEGAEPILNRLSMIVSHELRTPEVKLFDNPEINRLIDENYKLVKENGYAELRIPERLHRIPREKISAAAVDTADLLIRSGFQACLVGGSVRDLILGTKVNDFDIVTDANFEEQKKIFAGHFSSHSHQNGINYGIAVYPGEEIDLAQMRNIPAAYYGLKNIPDFNPQELFSNNLRNDSFQRDLTLNAVYYDMKTGDLIDFQGGLYALREGIIESPAEPDVHFTDDPTSVICAMRFKARYGFRFSDGVEKVMRENSLKYMKLLTPESISFYLNSMFGHDYSAASYEVLNDYGVFEYFFPALKDICRTEEYKRYAANAMKLLDAQKSPGKNLWLALLLWPAVKNSDADSVLNEHGKIYRFSDGQIDSLKEIFAAENIIETVSKKRKMIELAIKDYPHLKLSRYEAGGDNTSHHYTYETMAGLRKLYPDTEFCFICGGDTLSRVESYIYERGLYGAKTDKTLSDSESDKERQESKALRQKSWDEFIKRRAEPSGLDPLSELYFYETDKSKIVPVENLRIVETVTPESIAEAEKNLRCVLTGEISKLKPLTVVARNDGKGTYCIFDGNNIYSALVKRGVKNVPVLEILRPYQKDVTTLEELYEMNREAQNEFNALMKDLQQELGGELKVRPSLKGEARIREKTQNQFDGDFSRVIDVLAGTLIFESKSEILNAVEKLKARDDVVWIGDRWNKPMDGSYRDFSVNIRMSSGAIVELQLHHRGIIEAKEGESGEGLGHLIYIFMRTNRYRDDMA